MGRGRKPKERLEYVGAVSDACDIDLSVPLEAYLAQVPEEKRGDCLRAIGLAVTYYQAMSEVNAERKHATRGNKPKAHISLLLRDIAAAWMAATGDADVSLWQSEDGRESWPVAVARVCLSVARGKPYIASLRQQFAGAARWKTPR